jgi:hypothetical protein
MQDGSYEFTQPISINAIISDVNLTNAKVKPFPAKVSMPLHSFKADPPFNLEFNNCSAIGKLSYITQTLRGGIMYTIHQIAKYSSDPRGAHGEAFLYLIHYLKKTHDLDLGVCF